MFGFSLGIFAFIHYHICCENWHSWSYFFHLSLCNPSFFYDSLILFCLSFAKCFVYLLLLAKRFGSCEFYFCWVNGYLVLQNTVSPIFFFQCQEWYRASQPSPWKMGDLTPFHFFLTFVLFHLSKFCWYNLGFQIQVNKIV